MMVPILFKRSTQIVSSTRARQEGLDPMDDGAGFSEDARLLSDDIKLR